jgi:hypothetical protein
VLGVSRQGACLPACLQALSPAAYRSCSTYVRCRSMYAARAHPAHHAQLPALASYRAAISTVPDDSTQLLDLLGHRLLVASLTTSSLTADAALLGWPRPRMSEGRPGQGNMCNSAVSAMQGRASECKNGPEGRCDQWSHNCHTSNWPGSQPSLSAPATTTSTTRHMVDIRGLITNCARTLQWQLAGDGEWVAY